MKNDLKHKLFMGFRGVMMRIPSLLSDKGARKGEKGAQANADPILCSAYHSCLLQKQRAQALWTCSDESHYSSGQKRM